jgi:TrmH family RNA methyltransferase
MLTKDKIKSIQQLKLKKFRESSGLFVVEGNINTNDYLESNLKLVDLFLTNNFLTINKDRFHKYDPTIISEKDMSRISALKNHSPVLAVFKIPDTNSKPDINSKSFYLALDDIHDPGNLGTIIRTADWFGIDNIFCSKGCVDAYNPKVVQASMGSLARVKLNYMDLKELFKNNSLPVYGSVLDGVSINDITKPEPGFILIGSEAKGIDMNLMNSITHRITIPLNIGVRENFPESLNASVATGILCYSLTQYHKLQHI